MMLTPFLDAPRSRRRSRRVRAAERLTRGVSVLLILAGTLLLADVAITLVWQEPVSALLGTLKRDGVDRRYASLNTAPLSPHDVRALASLRSVDARIAYLAWREKRQLRPGDAVGRLTVPRLGDAFEIVEGTDRSSLEAGPGHYPASSLPGLGRTVAVAGHRTTYLAPFRHLDAMRRGDRIVVAMPYGRFSYLVQAVRVVAPNALWVTRSVGYDRLVLTACTPLFTAKDRLVVFARLDAVAPARQLTAKPSNGVVPG
jgi:sortase A